SVHTPDVIAHQARPDVRVHLQVDDIALIKNGGGFAGNAKSVLAIAYAFAHARPPLRVPWRSLTREAPTLHVVCSTSPWARGAGRLQRERSESTHCDWLW